MTGVAEMHSRCISIHALHEESDPTFCPHFSGNCSISIHALHEESDVNPVQAWRLSAISIHALHEESDL